MSRFAVMRLRPNRKSLLNRRSTVPRPLVLRIDPEVPHRQSRPVVVRALPQRDRQTATEHVAQAVVVVFPVVAVVHRLVLEADFQLVTGPGIQDRRSRLRNFVDAGDELPDPWPRRRVKRKQGELTRHRSFRLRSSQESAGPRTRRTVALAACARTASGVSGGSFPSAGSVINEVRLVRTLVLLENQNSLCSRLRSRSALPSSRRSPFPRSRTRDSSRASSSSFSVAFLANSAGRSRGVPKA